MLLCQNRGHARVGGCTGVEGLARKTTQHGPQRLGVGGPALKVFSLAWLPWPRMVGHTLHHLLGLWLLGANGCVWVPVFALMILAPSAAHVAHVRSIEDRNGERYPLLTGGNFWIYLVMGVRYGLVGLVPGL